MLSKLIRRGRQIIILLCFKFIYKNCYRFDYNELRVMANFKVYVSDQKKIKIDKAYFNNVYSTNFMVDMISIGKNCLFGDNLVIGANCYIYIKMFHLIQLLD